MNYDENQNLVDSKRHDLLNGKLSYDSYYLWLSEFLEIPGYMVPFSNG